VRSYGSEQPAEQLKATQLFVLELEHAPVVQDDFDITALAGEARRNPLDDAFLADKVVGQLGPVAYLSDFDAFTDFEVLGHCPTLFGKAARTEIALIEAGR